jgi:flagellar biosynthetic protein FlhB
MSDTADKSQKTEQPTQKKIEEARRKGDTPQSQEVKHWFMLLAGGIAVWIFADEVALGVRHTSTRFLDHAHEIRLDRLEVSDFLVEIGWDLAVVMFLPLLLLFVAAIACNTVVAKPTWSPDKIRPKLSKLSVVSGAKKIVGVRSFVELGKAIFKLLVIGAFAIIVILPDMQFLRLVPTMSIIDVVHFIEQLALLMIATVVGVMTFIAIADWAFQKYKWTEDHKMTKQEVKDERKQADGDPQIKNKIRVIRMQRAMARMASAIPTADVILTNPTHYAVALKYDQETMAAPILVAKGVDHLALRIREIAAEYDIPILENPPLARALYSDVEIEQQIPSHFYKAAAEIIGYVLRLKGKLPGPPGPKPKVENAVPAEQ